MRVIPSDHQDDSTQPQKKWMGKKNEGSMGITGKRKYKHIRQTNVHLNSIVLKIVSLSQSRLLMSIVDTPSVLKSGKKKVETKVAFVISSCR